MIGVRQTSLDQLTVEHTLEVSTLTGSAQLSVPIRTSPGRESFGPALALGYGSGEGNSSFGVGWYLSGVPSIGIDARRGLPTYEGGSDRYMYSGGQELVECRRKQGPQWLPVVEAQGEYRVHRFRSTIERSFERFERWTSEATGRQHWVAYARNGVVSIFGLASDNSTRITDPRFPIHRTFQWLLEAQFDSKGNAIVFEYKPEDGVGVDALLSYESRRMREGGGFAQRYLKRIKYGNTRPLSPARSNDAANEWRFELVLDYGEHATTSVPSPGDDGTAPSWLVRKDPFSNRRPGFELRTYRLCRRFLMFHHFPELGGAPCLVGATELTHQEDAAGAVLKAIRFRGYRKDLATGVTTQRAVPPLTLAYSAAETGTSFELPEHAENFPAGLDGAVYQWIDLKGEGLPGVLHRQGQAWYFKENLGGGRFGPLESVDEVPAAISKAFELVDFDLDGDLNLVGFEGREAGQYRRDRDSGRWRAFQSLHNLPRVDHANARVQWVDLNGDGHADLIVDHLDRLVWYPSRGADGFGSPIELAKPGVLEGGAPTLSQSQRLHTFFADMTGDGLPDLVQVQSGRVEYWPHLGLGRFGPGVVMEDAPAIDRFGQMDSNRIRLADLDGSGTASLIYIGKGELSIWVNHGGNSFGPEKRLRNLPYIDNLSSVHIFDFLSDGSRCLVWSTPLPTREGQGLQFLRLTGDLPPRMLVSATNGAGRESRLSYRSSAREYVRDKQSGRPWHTRLPHHPMVVDRLEGVDHIGGGRMVTRYEYRDGYFDSDKRRFIGFGLVDAFDSDRVGVAGTEAPAEVTPPSLTRCWYHTGADNGWSKRAQEFYSQDALAVRPPAPEIESVAELSTQEQLDALKALAGSVWRQEFFSFRHDGTREPHPLRTTEYAYRVRRLQPSEAEREGVFAYFQSESLTYEYEQDPSDPRVMHGFLVASDGYGSVDDRASLAYPRRPVGPTVHAEQRRMHAELVRRTHINIDTAARFEVGVEGEERRYSLSGLDPGPAAIFTREVFLAQLAAAVGNPLAFHEAVSTGAPQARLVTMRRNIFWDDAHAAPLAAGHVGSVTLLHHVERAVLPETAVDAAFGGHVTGTMLSAEGRYQRADGYWWALDTTYRYGGAQSFYRLAQESNSGGNRQTFTFDAHGLLVVAIEDILGNRVESTPDYQVLASAAVKDANDNISEVVYDPLGVAVVTAVHGEQIGSDGAPHAVGADQLTTYAVQQGYTGADVLADPARFLQSASRFYFCDFEAFERGDGPPRTIQLEQERHAHDGEGTPPTAGRIRVTAVYVDGFGRAVQTKVRAGPGPAIQRNAAGVVVLGEDGAPVLAPTAERWLTSGHDIFNNKGWLVRKYEPLFTISAAFDSDDALRHYGVSTRAYYDPVGRVVRQDLPNGAFTTSAYSAWDSRQSDPNDNVVGSRYEALRHVLPDSDPEKDALTKAQAHARTPTIVERDVLGRPFRLRELGEGGVERITTTFYGVLGLPDRIIDPRGLSAVTYGYDMLGRSILERSVDAGDRWTFLDADGRPVHRWDGRGVHIQHHYDQNGRLARTSVDGALGFNNVVERVVYGDDPAAPQAKLRNARGRAVEHYDNAGVVRYGRYHLDGQVADSVRVLRDGADSYKSTVDWSSPGAVQLSAVQHRTRNRLDGLGRVVSQSLPDGTTREYGYAPLGHISDVRVTTADGQLNSKVIASNIEANGRGQRTQIRLGNGVETSYEYDALTFRLGRLHTRRAVGGSRDYLDVFYTYDPVGNLTRWVDHVQDPRTTVPLLQGLTTSSACEFTYDAFYQLKEATGRVHQALLEHDYRDGLPDPDAIKGTRHLSLNNGAAVERYERLYDYDLAGNLQRIRHQGASQAWTTELWTSATSNRSLLKRDLNGIDVADPESWFDENGNTTRLPHLREMRWDHFNRLVRAVVIDRSAADKPDDAEYYVYGADGLRVRRVTERLVAGQVEVTDVAYLNGCELKRIDHAGNPQLRRTTSHITDGASRLATLHQWTLDQARRETDNIAETKLHYLTGNHLGSVALELDDAGDVISYEEYFPYGGTSFVAGRSARDVKLKDYRYSGKCRDDATGLYYYEYRHYAPFIGGWLSPDPLGPVDGLNLYRFVRNNPIRFIDADGLQTSFPDTPTTNVGRQRSVRGFSDLDITPRTKAAYDAVQARVVELKIPNVTVVWSTRESQWFLFEGDISALGKDLVVPSNGFFNDGEGEGEGSGSGTGAGNDQTPQEDPNAGGGGDKDGSEGADGKGAEGESAQGQSSNGRSGGERGTKAGKGQSTGNSRSAGQNSGQKEGSGEANGEGSNTGAPGSPPVPPGIPAGPTGTPYSPDLQSPEVLPESGTPGADGFPPRTGAEAGDAQGQPASSEGTTTRPGGIEGGVSGGETPGGADASGSGGTGSGGEPGGEEGGIRGGRGWLSLPTWLAAPINAVIGVLAAVADAVQFGLDIIGLIPGLGEIADGLNGLISLARGDYAGAALSFAAMIPFAGWAATAGKFGRKAVDAVDAVSDVTRAASKYGDEAASVLGAASRNADEAAQFATKNSEELAKGDRLLYRSMRETSGGLPEIGDSARTLGVRTKAPRIDIHVEGGLVKPGTGGMSASPDTPMNLPLIRRPKNLDGKGPDPAWRIRESDLGPNLRFRQDTITHGHIEPAFEMTLDAYRGALADLQGLWSKL